MSTRPTCSLLPQLAALIAAAGFASVAAGAEFFAGEYSFSDELGSFRLLSASGLGTSDDPVVVVEEFPSVGPVTLVIRRHNRSGAEARPTQALTLVKRVLNRSNRVWDGFEMELQEILGKPSPYSDGLSFKQFGASPTDVESDAFSMNERRFEPYDRITFQGGSVDPGETVTFRVTITDPTPVREFYLVQDPNLVSAELPGTGRSFAVSRTPSSPAEPR